MECIVRSAKFAKSISDTTARATVRDTKSAFFGSFYYVNGKKCVFEVFLVCKRVCDALGCGEPKIGSERRRARNVADRKACRFWGVFSMVFHRRRQNRLFWAFLICKWATRVFLKN